MPQRKIGHVFVLAVTGLYNLLYILVYVCFLYIRGLPSYYAKSRCLLYMAELISSVLYSFSHEKPEY